MGKTADKKTLVKSRNNIMGLVHPYRPEYKVMGKVEVGTTVYEGIKQAFDAAKIRRSLLKNGIAQIGWRDIEKGVTHWEFVPFSQWKKRKIQEGEIVRFRILPKGGGGGGGDGGKNTGMIIGQIAIAIVAVVSSALTYGALTPGWSAYYAGMAASFVGMAVMTIGSAVLNSIAPVASNSLGNFSGISRSSSQESDVYSISSGKNTINQWGRVPVPCGHGRFAPPKAAGPYTQLQGEDQYLHELLCLGIGDMEISGIKIGTTPIENFNDCFYEVMTYKPNRPRAPLYYPTGVYEETLNIQLKEGIRNVRTTNECDSAEIDFSFNGLCHINNEGNPERLSVSFNIQYRESGGSGNWTDVGKKIYIPGKTWRPQEEGTYFLGVRENGIFSHEMPFNTPNQAARIGFVEHTITEEEYEEWEREPSDGSESNRAFVMRTRVNHHYEFTADPEENNLSFDGFDVTTRDGYSIDGGSYVITGSNKKEGGVIISGGNVISYYDGNGTRANSAMFEYTVEGAQTRLLRKTYTIKFPKRGSYDIAITRTTEDSDDTRIRDESYWQALRSITTDLPVNTSYPVMLLSLRIKATGQLSGSIDTLTVYYETKCQDYDISKKKWVTRYTSNPAAIFRYILQQKDAFSRPQSTGSLDLPSIEEAYRYYETLGFRYDKVMDQSVSIFERLVSICASALSSPTMLEAKWGIIVDKPRTNVVCAFTSANAWNWNFERQQIRLPNAIHCNFINEETWDADMRVVPTDEVSSSNYLYETQDYDGVTSPQQVYLLARFHYADAKMRRRAISFTCFDESLLCTRGDLIELACPNVSIQGLQVGRIRKITRNTDGQVVSFTTDQINTTDFSGRRFGVRIYANNGNIFHAEIRPENRSQRSLTLMTPQAMAIENGNKYALGDYDEEVFQAIVLSMKPNPDWTCEVSCQDYIPYIYRDLSKPIPDWTSVITKPIEHKWILTATPIIVKLISDESTLIKGSDGTLQCRILVYVNDPLDIDPKAALYNCEIREILDSSDPDNVLYSPWTTAARGVPIEQSQFFINEVNEGSWYQIRIRYGGNSGEYGPWAKIVEHQVVGKVSNPPDVQNFMAVIDNPNGIILTWDMLKVLDIAYYKIDGDAQDNALASPAIEKVFSKTGQISFSIVAVDVGGRTSKNPAYASVEVLAPKIPTFQSVQLLNPGIVCKWLSAMTTWDIDLYHLSCSGRTSSSSELEGIIPFSGDFPIGAYADIRCVDIFKNPCTGSGSRMVTVYYPSAPDITIGFNKLNGNITLDWQDCKNQEVENAPDIDHYEIKGTLANNQVVSVKGTHYESIVPLIVYEFGAGSIEGGIPVNVGNLYIVVDAVDKYGIKASQKPGYVSNEKNIAIYPPYNPTDFGVSASLTTGENLKANWTEATAIMLTWRDCERTFAIDYYVVYDYFTMTEYKVATNYVVLPARKEGSYKITVQAFDVLGLSSAKMEYNLTIAGVGGMEVTGKVDGSDILLEWTTPPASFQIDHYLVFADNDDIPDGTNSDMQRDGYLGTAKFNYFRIPAKELGSKTYYVWAVDVAGNINSGFANYTSVEIFANPAPQVSASILGNGVGLSWGITNRPVNTLPVVAWKIRRYPKLANSGQIPLYSPIQDYGQIAANKLNVDAFAVGNYSFAVQAIDSGGNEGAWGLCDFTVTKPGQVTFVNQVVIDNNIQLYWSAPNYIFFPIKEYIFDEVDRDTGIHMRIGLIDAQFASETEEVAGEYTYAITPVDWGGNLGTPTTITLRVSQPPDFVFYDKKESLFNGTRVNMVLDGKGHLLGPVPVGETWQQNISRMTSLAGTTISTWQQKIDKGWKYWLDPWTSPGTYTEVIDHGAIVPSSNYNVNLSWLALEGSPVITCKIEVSEDGTNWRLASDNALVVYVTQFRYSRITLTVTGGYVQINNMLVDLKIKKLVDSGRILSKATDNGAGWISESQTPMLTGTWVDFKVDFVDVQSFPRPNVLVESTAQEGYTAYTVFEDVINPTGFRVFVKDKNGARVTAKVDWQAFGV